MNSVLMESIPGLMITLKLTKTDIKILGHNIFPTALQFAATVLMVKRLIPAANANLPSTLSASPG